jgi:hypothetical protein
MQVAWVTVSGHVWRGIKYVACVCGTILHRLRGQRNQWGAGSVSNIDDPSGFLGANGLANEVHILLNKMAMNLKTGMGVDEIKSRGILCQL